MKVKFTYLLLILSIYAYAQDYSASWKEYFSYLNITDISKGDSKIYAAAENTVFSYDNSNKDIETISTINGLSGETISTINYSEANNTLLIGYENGLIQVYDTYSKTVTTVIDIVNKQTIPSNSKRINHFYIYNDTAYISTAFGISTYNIKKLEFGDTYFIGDGNTQVNVKQATLINDYIYIATEIGIKKALYTNPNLIDAKQWETVSSGNFSKISSTSSKIYALKSDKKLYDLTTNVLTEVATYDNLPTYISTTENKILVTTPKKIYVYDTNFSPLLEIDATNYKEDALFSCSLLLESNDDLFIGTKMPKPTENAGYGVLKTTLTPSATFENIHPDSPLSNKVFRITAKYNQIWTTYGEYKNYNPYPLNLRGFSYFKNDKWTNVNAENVINGAKVLSNTTINPFNTENVFISSFFNGLIEINNNKQEVLYDESNSGLEALILLDDPDYKNDIRVVQSKFDSKGILWTASCLVENTLKSFNLETNEWKKYSFSSISNTVTGPGNIGDFEIDDDYIWLASEKKGIIGFRRKDQKIVNIESIEKNMPSVDARAVAIDQKKSIWIGTNRGLRTIYSPSEFFNNPNYKVSDIIVLDNGVASELLYQQEITDIVVDGANNKWVATLGTGVYFLSEDGQQTINHFTTDNSPLPTNDVFDLEFDDSTGLIYMATGKGLLAYNSGSSNAKSNLNDAFVYPNPVKPNFDMLSKKIKIKNISDNVNIKITDIEGNLVTEAQSRINQKYKGFNLEIDGGTAFWNGKNLSGNTVASGVYIVFISDLDSNETKTLKIMVVR